MRQLVEPKLQVIKKEEIISPQPIQTQQVIEKEEIETVEKIYRNWNDEIKAIKSTTLIVEGKKKEWNDLIMEENIENYIFGSRPKQTITVQEKIEKEIVQEKEKEKEEFLTEKYAFNIISDNKKIQGPLLIEENNRFYIEGTKSLILKEGPAETIKVTKELILIPSRISQFIIKSQPKKQEKIEEVKKVEIIEEKRQSNKIEVIKPILKTVKENTFFIQGIKPKQVQQVHQIKTVQVEKHDNIITKNWNDINALSKECNFNL